MTRIEELAPASKPASFGFAQLIAQRPGVIHGSQKQREVPAVLVWVVCDIDGPRLDQDRSEHGRAGELDFSSFQQHPDLSAPRESLRPTRHGDRPAGRDGEQRGLCPDTIGGEYIDDGVAAPESMSPPIRRRSVELVPETLQRPRGFLRGSGQGTDVHHQVDVAARQSANSASTRLRISTGFMLWPARNSSRRVVLPGGSARRRG